MKKVAKSFEGFIPKGELLMARKRKASAAKSAHPSSSLRDTVKYTGTLADLEKKVCGGAGCKKCKLGATRNKIVFGDGSPKARLVLVGEAPGEQEDLTGKPFVGRAGQLLSKMLNAIGLERSDVYICNVAKCRPPENRNPEPDEIEACSPYLFAQLDALKPELILTLGKFSSQTLLNSEITISNLRGKIHDYRGTKLLATFHPSYLLRNPSAKKEAWEDLKEVARILKLKIPKIELPPGAKATGQEIRPI